MKASEAKKLANKKYMSALESMKKAEMDKILKGIKKQAKLGQFFYDYRITDKNFNVDVYDYISKTLKELGYTIYHHVGLEINWENAKD